MAKLHLWGELDDLPSIDAECIASLALLTHFGNFNASSISSSFDPSISPNGDFPLLEVDGHAYAGYSSILDCLQSHSNSSHSEKLAADVHAWSSFIQQRGQRLLDLYFYVSSNNYWDSISPAFTKILPWYSNYIIPPARRAAAIARTSHLGIRSLDLDSIDEYAAGDDVRLAGQPTKGSNFAGPINPEQMIKKQQSAKWLKTQQHSDTFQLFQLTKSFFSPLEELLGDKQYLLTNDKLTSVDCIAAGYLSLMRYASVPQPWLGDALRTRFPKLHAYAGRIYTETFDSPQRPWKSRISNAASPTPSQALLAIARGGLQWALPSLKETITPDQSVDKSSYQKPNIPEKSIFSALLTPTVLLPLGAVAGIAFGITKYIAISDSQAKSKHTFHATEYDFLSSTKLTDFGESGAMLSALGQRFDFETQYQREKERTGGATLVEVDVENEKGEVGRDVILKR